MISWGYDGSRGGGWRVRIGAGMRRAWRRRIALWRKSGRRWEGMMRFIQFIAVAVAAISLRAEEPVLPAEAVALLA